MKRFTQIIALLFAVLSLQAQKIDTRLTSLLPTDNMPMSIGGASASEEIDTAAVKSDINVRFNPDFTVRSFSAIAMLKQGSACPVASLQALGIEIRLQVGRMLILTVPAESLMALDDIDEIESVSADQMNQLMNNVAREKSHVNEVATTAEAVSHNLPQAYTGKGVLLGIIDSGIDYNHAAFRNADGSTRIKLALVLSMETDNYDEYTSPEDIEQLTSDKVSSSHGTHVAGIAGGSIVEGLDKQGMAPEADLMLCGLGDYLYDSYIISAITRMFDFAKEQGQPCVVNLSLGYSCFFHDGTSSEIVQCLKEYYKTEENKKGRIIVLAGCNFAGCHSAIYTTLPEADSDGYNLKTVLGEDGKDTYEGMEVNRYSSIENFFYNIDGSEFDVELKVVDTITGQVYTLDEKPLYTTYYTKVSEIDKTSTTSYLNNKYYIGYDSYSTRLFHEPNLKLAYFVKGQAGKIFRAIDGRITKSSGYHSYGLPGYTDGGDNGAFSVDICCEEAIGVGVYYSATSYMDINGNIQQYRDESQLDKIVHFSSWGTDDNGMNHPDVVAPGAGVCSAYNNYDADYIDAKGEFRPEMSADLTDGVNLFGRNHYYGVKEGTSMAAPHVAGIIALWLQAKPDMTYADVRTLIQQTSYNDDYTTNPELIPSGNVIQAGAGKIDALAGLQELTG
ncbi:MAG: S8 family serine peptidase, partial [Prevotella sp.]|nr:S8 family serine peptidase [Prevotella sp.]